MKLTEVVAGQQVQAEVIFKNADGTPITAFTAPVVYRINDFNDEFVMSAACAQDAFNLSRWTAQFTIPTAAPIGKAGQKYSITWTAKVGTRELERSDSFDVLPANDFENIDIEQRLALQGTMFEDTLVVPANEIVDSLSVRLVDIRGNELYASGALSPVASKRTRQSQAFYHASPTVLDGMVVPSMYSIPYQIEWTYGGTKVYHYLFVINGIALDMLRQIRSMVDKARNIPYNPALMWLDTDLMNYLDMGFQTFNSKPPVQTGFGITSLPNIFRSAVIQCAMYHALRAQLLAESQAAFNFGGQSVSLDVDRTAAIESELGRLQSFIDAEIKPMKRNWLRSTGGGGGGTGAGVLGVNIGPSLAWSPPAWGNGRLLSWYLNARPYG